MGYALVLSGGGAKGSYQIGVYKALAELGIKIDAVIGTSVGALNGAMFVQGDYGLAYDVWTKMEYKDVIDVSNISELKNKKLGVRELARYVTGVLSKGGLDVSPLRELLLNHIDEGKIRKSKTDFGLVTVSVNERKPIELFKKDIPKGKLVEYLLASAALPLFKNQYIDDKLFLDGGFYDNMPINMAAGKGYKNIIVVNLSGIGIIRKVKFKDINIKKIKNSGFIGGILAFSKETAKKNINLGYLDTMKAFGKIKGKRYFIYPINSKKDKLAAPIDEKIENDIYEKLKFPLANLPDRLTLNYKLLRELKKYAGEKLDYENTITAALEITAEIMGIDPDKVYNAEELAKEIIDEYLKAEDMGLDWIKKHIQEFIEQKKHKRIKFIELKKLISPHFLNNINKFDSRYLPLITYMYPKLGIANLTIYILSLRSGHDNKKVL